METAIKGAPTTIGHRQVRHDLGPPQDHFSCATLIAALFKKFPFIPCSHAHSVALKCDPPPLLLLAVNNIDYYYCYGIADDD